MNVTELNDTEYRAHVREQITRATETLSSVMLGDLAQVAHTTGADLGFEDLCAMIKAARNAHLDLEKRNDQLEQMIGLDTLTDLPNRYLFKDRLSQAILELHGR